MPCPNCHALRSALSAAEARHAEVHRQERLRLAGAEKMIGNLKSEIERLRSARDTTTAVIRKPSPPHRIHG
jgi:hypothetical protein